MSERFLAPQGIDLVAEPSARRSGAARPAALGLLAAAMLAAAVWRIGLSFGHMLWLDELYTTTLIGAPSLGHLWDAALRGVDGNPPLYLSLAWMLTSAVPADPERVLRAMNLVLMAATAALLYRLGRRVAAPIPVATVLALLPAVDGTVQFALLELRTYALYLFLVTATLAAALRLVDRPDRGRAALLAGVGVSATLAHSFGGFYVLATLGAAGLSCLLQGQGRIARILALAAVPPALTLAGWVALSLPAQMAVATPYGWILRPDVPELLRALTGSGLLSLVLLVGLLGGLAAALARAATRRIPHRAPPAPRCDAAALHAAVGAYAALTLAGWAGSQVITPFFVPRYFGPNLLIAALVLMLVAEAARRRIGARAAAVALVACGSLGVWSMARVDPRSVVPCRDADGRFLEEAAARDGTPVVAESPHAWFPRARYAPAQSTLYPLDWSVVLDQPYRARNNAVDFHIMDILRGWAPPGSPLAVGVLSTGEILERNGRFLVLDEDGRAWFDAVRARGRISATLIKAGEGCRLWSVERVP